MREYGKRILIAILLVVILPGLMLRYVEDKKLQNTTDASVKVQSTEPKETEKVIETTVNEITEVPEATEGQATTTMLLLADGSVLEMEEDAYIVGVILAEMPVSFHDEALKAQAVVARTYARKILTAGRKHENIGICTDSGCCQAYCSPEAFLDRGGSPEDVERIQELVRQTQGEALYYGGSLIEATYFSCSGGRTEDAVAVWGTEIPYLQAQFSPGEEQAAHYTDTVQFQAAKFAELLQLSTNTLPGAWFGNVTYTAGGGVDSIEICGQTFLGRDLRRILGLRSTAFQISAVGQTIYITTRGFGHRVGMSQYGAEAMAIDGNTYRQILQYYYPGTVLKAGEEIDKG